LVPRARLVIHELVDLLDLGHGGRGEQVDGRAARQVHGVEVAYDHAALVAHRAPRASVHQQRRRAAPAVAWAGRIVHLAASVRAGMFQ